MGITPDTKDWTWVLERPCPECGFDTQGFAVEAVPGMIMANTAAWQAALDGASDARARPEPSKWSPLEYACHVRDVFRLYDQRLELMLSQEARCSRTGTRTRPPSPTATASRTPPRSRRSCARRPSPSRAGSRA